MAPKPAPAGGNGGGGGDEGFVLLEGPETIGQEMQRQQQQQQGQAAGEYELASFSRRNLSSISSSARLLETQTQQHDQDVVGGSSDDDEDSLSLSDMPEDLRGLCRRLRAQSRRWARGGNDEGETTTDEDEKQEERQRRRLRRAAAAAARQGRGIHGFLCFAWPIGTRELMFWVVLAVVATTLVTLGGGRTRATVGGGVKGGVRELTPLYVWEEDEVHTGTSPQRRNHYQDLLSPFTEIRELKAQLEGKEKEVEDKENELAWYQSMQYRMETQARCLMTQLKAVKTELSRTHAEAEAQAQEETSFSSESTTTSSSSIPRIHVMREVRVRSIADEQQATTNNNNNWWVGEDSLLFDAYLSRAREGVMSMKGNEKVAPPMTCAVPPFEAQLQCGVDEEEEEEEMEGGHCVCECECEEEEWDEEDDEWWEEEEDEDEDWEDWDDDDEEEEDEMCVCACDCDDVEDDDDDDWWGEDDDEEEGDEDFWVPPTSPFVKTAAPQRWDEAAAQQALKGKKGGACKMDCAAPDWFEASKKVAGLYGVCAVQPSASPFF